MVVLRPTGHVPEGMADEPVHFSGISFRDGHLVTRDNAGAFRWGAESHDGNYVAMVADADGLTISSDAFGIGIIYIYRSPNRRAVILSNNLHMLVTICRHIGLTLHADERSFLKRLYPYSLGQQPSGFTVFFEETELLGANQYVRIREDEVIIDEKPRARHETYQDAMGAGIEAMLQQVRAVAGFSRYLIYRLSGGYDSRAVFGTLLRENLIRGGFHHFRSQDGNRAERRGGECFRDFYFPVPDIEEPGVLEREVASLVARRLVSRRLRWIPPRSATGQANRIWTSLPSSDRNASTGDR